MWRLAHGSKKKSQDKLKMFWTILWILNLAFSCLLNPTVLLLFFVKCQCNLEIASAMVLMFVSPKHICWNPNLCYGIRRQSLWEVRRSWGWSHHEWIVHLYNGIRIHGLPSPFMWEHNWKTPSVKQEVGSHWTTNILAPWSWIYQPPELWEINFCL